MSRANISMESFSDAQKREFKRLTSAPKLSTPTIVMTVALSITYLFSYIVCGWLGLVPLWVGTLLNAIVGYVSFSVIHDSIHRAISTNTKLNDRVGQIGLDWVLPYVDLRMFRWAHILHHRFASGEKDPDRMFNGAWWTLPFRWMAIDACYFVHALNTEDKVCKPYFRACLRRLALVVAVVAVATYFGYGFEVFMLWFVPSRLILLMLGFSFFWLPHVPHDTPQEENYTRATTVRKGFEWFMNPVLQYQNYHLIHHLFPMTPFYNNERVFKLLEPELRRHDLAIQHDFAIRPTIYPGKA
ncbi:fatty acid desaturase [Spongiibacter taiwanensis]|uniref:fatty acid desaturase n=1 Tax=Spongiibacter taiwanensis TaxID=1748242 RepID=UPI002034EB5D|nr:fatty acid desaturase [Spongiibacter taiwanensis]USA42585.1 fatty acid desaturase [Spongiibacter taiwanensis]